MCKKIDLNISKEEADLLDSVLTNELIRVEFPNGKQKTDFTNEEKEDYNVLSELLRKVENATVELNQ
jgi:hypothetical protein